jgi:hypothetical protein
MHLLQRSARIVQKAQFPPEALVLACEAGQFAVNGLVDDSLVHDLLCTLRKRERGLALAHATRCRAHIRYQHRPRIATQGILHGHSTSERQR